MRRDIFLRRDSPACGRRLWVTEYVNSAALRGLPLADLGQPASFVDCPFFCGRGTLVCVIICNENQNVIVEKNFFTFFLKTFRLGIGKNVLVLRGGEKKPQTNLNEGGKCYDISFL